jgi:hypothetical protein
MKGLGRYTLNSAAVQTFAKCQSLLYSRDSVIQSSLMYLYRCVGIDRTLQLADFRSYRRIFLSYLKQCCALALNSFASIFQEHNSVTVFITGHCAGVSILIN